MSVTLLKDLQLDIDQLIARGRFKEFHITNSRSGGEIEIRGRKCIDFTNWDYLDLNNNRDVKRAIQSCIEQVGSASPSPRLVAGTSDLHFNAENRIAKFLGTETALLFHSKNQAVLSLATALSSERDVWLVEDTVQSPVSDAAYLMNSSVESFKDISGLEAGLKKHRSARRKFIYIEALSPLTGALADLTAMVDLSRSFNASLLLDESVAIGAIGARGAGGGEFLVEKLRGPLINAAVASCADLSLGVASFGAVVAGPKTLIDYVINRSRTVAVDSPLPSYVAAQIVAAIDTLELKPLERAKLATMARTIKGAVKNTILRSPIEAQTPIVSLQFEKLSQAFEMQSALLGKGIFVEAIPVGTQLSEGGVVRFILNVNHSEKHMEEVLRVLAEVGSRLDVER